jgi:23S rRNA (cytosine1962-C5)-methyltransferase
MTRPPARITVNGYSEQWVRKGFAWVYPNEIESGGAAPGAQVTVITKSGSVLGRGVYDNGWLAVRIMRHDDGELDQQWMDSVLDAAFSHRVALLDEETTGYRLVNAENDGFPGVRIDRWGHFIVVVLDSPSLGGMVEGIVDWLNRNMSPRGVFLAYRLDPRDKRTTENVHPVPGLISGRNPTTDVIILERGLKLLTRPAEGPDVGVYADMRDIRGWLEPHWGGRRVLNTFCYTGAFSVAAAFHGASHVTSVDLSKRYLDRAEDNFRANDLDPTQHDFIANDTFKALDRFRRQGDEFDLVLVDPPSSSHASEGHWSGSNGWARLVAASAKVVAPGGWLVTASNQGEISPHKYHGMVTNGLRKAGRQAQLLYVGGQAPDFPAATNFPEGRYLKVAVWRLL